MIYGLTACVFNKHSTSIVHWLAYLMGCSIIISPLLNAGIKYRDLPNRCEDNYYESSTAQKPAKQLLHFLSKIKKKKYPYKYEEKCLDFVKKHRVPYKTTKLIFPVDFSDAFANRALHYAVWLNFHELTKLLLECGASPDFPNHHFATPLSLAKNQEMQELINQYISPEIDIPSATTTKGFSDEETIVSDFEDEKKSDQ